ncbi:MAG: hypothetical protein JWM68_2023 [Verrucomicrobiales bacterium]|nr:hypothetical protein [Verrucomicrobiales bacterium]
MSNLSNEKPTPPTSPSRGRRFKLFLGVTIFLAFLCTIIVLIKKSHAQSEWEHYQQELATAGEHLDWDYFIPPEIKAEENFYAAPFMKDMFQRQGGGRSATNQWILPENDRRWESLNEKETFIKSPNGVTYPISVVFQWEKDHQQLLQIFFEACQRPKSRVLTDFKNPISRDMPNFVTMRSTAQAMSTLAKAHLAAGHPEEAMRYLAGIHRLRQTLASGQTLVESMINVALGGVYIEVVRDGFEQKSWSDEQLRTLQKKLLELNCVPGLPNSLRAEVAGMIRTIDTMPASAIFNWSSYGKGTKWAQFERSITSMWQSLIFSSAREKNLLSYTRLMMGNLDSMDAKADRIYPKKCAAFMIRINSLDFSARENLLASIAIPNFTKATETTAKNQTLLNEAALVCALELFRRAQGHYPETLQELSPGYIAVLPHDIITGEPLRYQRTSPDAFKLYAVGWDGIDDGGIPTDWAWTTGK